MKSKKINHKFRYWLLGISFIFINVKSSFSQIVIKPITTTKTFNASLSTQSFTVPDGCNSIIFELWGSGAKGEKGTFNSRNYKGVFGKAGGGGSYLKVRALNLTAGTINIDVSKGGTAKPTTVNVISKTTNKIYRSIETGSGGFGGKTSYGDIVFNTTKGGLAGYVDTNTSWTGYKPFSDMIRFNGGDGQDELLLQSVDPYYIYNIRRGGGVANSGGNGLMKGEAGPSISGFRYLGGKGGNGGYYDSNYDAAEPQTGGDGLVKLTYSYCPKLYQPKFDIAKVDSICYGDVFTGLSKTSLEGITGTWSPAFDNKKSQQYTFTPNAGQCVTDVLTKVFITVNPIPLSPLLSKDTVICENEALNLNVNSNDNISYEWTGPNGFYSNLKSPLVTSSVSDSIAGVYKVRAILNGCKSLPSSIEVKINKSKATVKNSCEGGKLELFASTIPGATYFWTGPNGFTSTLQNPVIDSVKSSNSSGSYMVYTTVNNCISPVPGEVNVSVLQIPVPTGVVNNGPLCIGKILSLSTDSITGATYLWTGPNGFTSTLRNPIVSANFSTLMVGAYNLNVSLNGCASQPLTSNVELNKTSASTTPVCVGGDFKLTASNVTGAVYNWTGPNGFTSSLQNPIVSSNATSAMSGVYTVKSIVNGCTSPISSIIVTVNSTTVSMPSVVDNIVYCQNSISSKLNATGSNLKWYSVKDGGNSQLDAPTPVTQNFGITTYYVTQTTICESKRAEIKVSVVPSSKIFFDGLNAICSGSSKKLIAPVIEGMSFQWKKNGVAIAGAIDSVLIVNSAGSYSLSTSLGSACKSDAPEVTLSLIAKPSIGTLGGILTSTSKFAVCPSTTRANTTTVAGGTWASANNAIATVDNSGLVTGVAAGTTTVSYTVTDANGCSNQVSRSVIVDSKPTTPVIYGTNITMCQSGKGYITASLPNGTWSAIDTYLKFSTLNNGMFFQQNTIPTDNFVSGVKYTMFSTNRACTSEATKQINLRKLAQKAVTITATSTNLVVNQQVTATAATTMTAAGVWRSFLPASLSATVSPTNNKQATIKGLAVGTNGYIMFQAKDAATGCNNGGWLAFNVTATQSIVDANPTTVSTTTGVNVYPNPSKGVVTFENIAGANAISLVDMTGRTIKTVAVNTDRMTVDFSGVQNGKYLVQVAGENVNEVRSIVIE